jgi:hypothetical protein
MLKDVHITPYRARNAPHPYLQETLASTTVSEPEIPVPDYPWNGRSDEADYRNLRDEVLERDGHRCTHCGTNENLDVHHIVPRHNGGKDTLENLTTLCEQCHVAQGGYGRPRHNG